MSEFAPICIYFAITLLVYLIPFGLLFNLLQIVRHSLKYCQPTNFDHFGVARSGFDPFGVARSGFNLQFYLVSIFSSCVFFFFTGIDM